MESRKDLKFAVLIDADNVPYSKVKEMFEEIAKYGTPTFKRIYADWTKPTVSGWKNILLDNAITPIQQYSYSKGKNASDSALIIDAMDILYTGKVDGFCIVSSDSDFTRLATRLREAGMMVIGIGERKTLNAFITACDKFIYFEILGGSSDTDTETESDIDVDTDKKKGSKSISPSKKENKKSLIKTDPKTIQLITNSISDLGDDDGWAFLGDLGNLLLKKRPDFDPRNYGFTKLLPFIKSINKFEIDYRESGRNNIKHIFVRQK